MKSNPIGTASPILTSLLDTDAYKLHMQQAVFHQYPDVPVSAEFRCRNNDNLGLYIDEIAYQIDLMRHLVLTNDEYNYLAHLPFFKKDYLDWLKSFRYRPEQLHLTNNNGKLILQFSGNWLEVIMWEVPLLSLISEVVHRNRTPAYGAEQAVDQLRHKIKQFKQQSADIDMSLYQLADFGSRRRYSHAVHETIVNTLIEEIPNYFIGTSNYSFARSLNLSPIGTQAHEWFQAFQQISPKLANSQRIALQSWLDEYPDQLGIALTDCIAMDAFLRDFNPEFAKRYKGLRHDSGDPIEWGEKALAHYQQLGIDPKNKTLVFSDSLDLDKSLALYRHFHHRIQLIFGIGTQLTCNIPGVTPLNIVIKLVQCNGKPVAKISDSPGKTMCENPAFVKELHEAFNLPLANK